MKSDSIKSGVVSPASRLDYLDATRAFALVLGVIFHASLSFMPVFIGWAVQDVSTSAVLGHFVTVSHSFRMATFFLLAGFLGHLTFHRRGAKAFWRTRLVRIGVPLVVGWFLLRPLVVSGWIMGFASMRGEFHFWSAVGEGFASLRSLPEGLFLQTHLWFLYYLLLITGLTLGLRVGVKRWAEAIDEVFDKMIRSRAAMLIFTLPLALVLTQMETWGVDTPDRSLWPHGPVLLIYGGFFGGGWLIGRQPELLAEVGKLSMSRAVLVGLGVVVVCWLTPIQMDPGHPQYRLAHWAYAGGYAMMMVGLVGLTLGVFKKYLHQSRAWVRYVADSSYWMYLIHLPLVVWLQVAVAEWPLHWSLKLGFISGVTVAGALVSYDLLVRSTWLGVILNGRRRERVLTRGWGGREMKPGARRDGVGRAEI